MSDIPSKPVVSRRRDPNDIGRIFSPKNFETLARTVAPNLRPNEKSLVYVFPLMGRLGHLALEPHALVNLYREQFDNIILVVKPTPAYPGSQGLFRLAENYVQFVTVRSDEVMEMGNRDGNLQNFGPFSFALHSSQMLLAQFSETMQAGKKPIYFETPRGIKDQTEAFLGANGISQTDKIVALHLRDQNTHAFMAEQVYRNADGKNYVQLIEHLLAEGYAVVRLGDPNSVDLPVTHSKFIDLPKHGDYTDHLDVGIIDRAMFSITCASGPEAICRILGKPMIRVNCVAEHHAWLNPSDVVLFKTYWCRKRNRPLSYRELLFEGLSCAASTKDFDAADIDLVENTPDELLEAGKEMIRRLANGSGDNPDVQSKFRAIGSEFQTAFASWPPEKRLAGAPMLTSYAYALPWTNIAESYVEKYPEFLD